MSTIRFFSLSSIHKRSAFDGVLRGKDSSTNKQANKKPVTEKKSFWGSVVGGATF